MDDHLHISLGTIRDMVIRTTSEQTALTGRPREEWQPMQIKHVPNQIIMNSPSLYEVEPTSPQWRILVADDDPYIRQLL